MNLMLDPDTHELVKTAGNLTLVRKSPEVRQKLKCGYQFFLGEWFLDTTLGVPYYQLILVKNPNMDLVNSTLMSVALKTPGMLELRGFRLNYDRGTRELAVEIDGKSTDGDLEFETSIAGGT